MGKPPKILIGVLDWGLGHATRSIPFIKAYQAAGCEVMLGSAGRAGELLRLEFPELQYLELPAYKPSYPKDGNMVMAMATQSMRFLKVINDERRLLDKLITAHNIDLVASDNRFGLSSKRIPCYMICHQIFLVMPGIMRFLEPVVNAINRSYLDDFKAVWIPDHAGDNNLSGRLAHLHNLPGNFHFLGPVSRFKFRGKAPEPNTVLIMLSGPEPQRSLLEDILRQQCADHPYKFTLVQGITDKVETTTPAANLTIHSHMTSQELQEALERHELVVCRSGYTSLMDVATMRRKALLIPTPGQTEQAYLADHLKNSGWFVTTDQDKIWLKAQLEGLKNKAPDMEIPGACNDFMKVVQQSLYDLLEGL